MRNTRHRRERGPKKVTAKMKDSGGFTVRLHLDVREALAKQCDTDRRSQAGQIEYLIVEEKKRREVGGAS